MYVITISNYEWCINVEQMVKDGWMDGWMDGW